MPTLVNGKWMCISDIYSLHQGEWQVPRDPMSLGQPWSQNSGFQGAWRVAGRIQQDVGDNKTKAVDVD